MTAEVWSALLDAGSTGVVVFLIIYVLKFIERRDEKATARDAEFVKYIASRDDQLRNMFITMSTANAEELSRLTEVLAKIVDRLDMIAQDLMEHERKVNDRMQKLETAVGIISRLVEDCPEKLAKGGEKK